MTERAERERSSYLFPRHPREADRLDLQHDALREALGSNFLAPVTEPGRVLDVGTGTGRWGIEVCWEHPRALVVGFDLMAGPGEHPSGYRHVRGNVLQGLPFLDGVFDLVHQRFLVSGIPLAQWPQVVAELVRVTQPGGWVELAEPMIEFLHAGPATERLLGIMRDMAASRGLDSTRVVFDRLDDYLRSAPLKEVTRHEVTCAVGEWGGRIGSFLASDMRALFTRLCEVQVGSSLSAEESAETIRRTQEEFEGQQTRVAMAIAYGRKPS